MDQIKEEVLQIWNWLNAYPSIDLSAPADQVGQYLFDPVFNWLYTQALGLTQKCSKAVLTTPSIILKAKYFQNLYGKVTDITLGLLVLVIPTICILLIREKVSFEQIKESAFKILFLPVFIIFAPPILIKIIGEVNHLARYLVEAEKVMIGDPDSFGSILGLFLFMGAFVWYMFKLLLYYGKRNIKLMVLTLLAPLFYLLWCLPTHPHVLDRWKNDIISLLSTQLIHAFLLLILSGLTIGAGELVGMEGLPVLVIQVCGLWFMGEAEEWLKGYVRIDPEAPQPSKEISKRTRQVVNRVKNQAKETGKKLARRLIKWI